MTEFETNLIVTWRQMDFVTTQGGYTYCQPIATQILSETENQRDHDSKAYIHFHECNEHSTDKPAHGIHNRIGIGGRHRHLLCF